MEHTHLALILDTSPYTMRPCNPEVSAASWAACACGRIHALQRLLEGRLGLRPLELERGREQPVLHREGLRHERDRRDLRPP